MYPFRCIHFLCVVKTRQTVPLMLSKTYQAFKAAGMSEEQAARGRQLTAKAYQHFGKRKDQDLFG